MWTLVDYAIEYWEKKTREVEARLDKAKAELRKAQAFIAELQKNASGSGNNRR